MDRHRSHTRRRRFEGLRVTAGLVACVVAGLLAAPVATARAATPDPRSATVVGALDRAEARAVRDGEVPVIVRLDPDAARPTVHDAQAAIIAAVGPDATVEHRYTTIPAVALTVDATEIDRLRSVPGLDGVAIDRAASVDLASSVPSIGGDRARTAGATGRGQTIAILDTGVDASHPMLAGRVVGEACFSRGGNCPNGSTVQYGAGSGAPCTFASACMHGTHVAGIAAGDDGTTVGVAPDADLLAIQVASLYGGGLVSWTSDQLAGLDWIYAQRTSFDIAAVNISLGYSRFTDRATCDTEGSSSGYSAAVSRLRSNGTAVVAATANDGSGTGIAFPSCLTGVYGIGSTNDAGAVSSFSNRNALMSYWAPGESIVSSVPGGGTASASGTSMATPHAAGAFAVLAAARSGATLDSLAARLAATGTAVTGDGYSKPRIELWRALGIDAFAQALPVAPDIAAPLAATTSDATRETGEPTHAGVTSSGSLWWSFDAPTAGSLSLSTQGSGIRTVLAVYTGSAVGTLTPVASSADTGTGGSSAVAVSAVAGTHYSVAVAGRGTAAGAIRLAVRWAPLGGYHPVTPARVLDTRTSGGPIGAGATRSLGVLGLGGVPATGVRAVAMNVTVTDGSAPSVLTVWPSGQARPVASNLNWMPGDTRPNLVVSATGVLGAVDLYNLAGSVQVVADVIGWYDDGSVVGGADFHPLTPTRVLDTRDGTGSAAAPFGPGESRILPVAGRGGVPASGATAAVLNVTVTDPTDSSFLTIWPSDVARPLASSLNWPVGATRPNLVVAPLAGDGSLAVYNLTGRVQVIADVVGWYGGTDGSHYVAQSPVRVLDTRPSGLPLAQGESRTLTVAGIGGVPTWANAVVLNLTGTEPTAPTFVTAWPAGVPRPLASSLNLGAGETVPNLVVVPLGTGGAISLFNNLGRVHLVADVVGWYG